MGNVDEHLRLIVKRVVDFLLVIIKLFFARCYGCIVMYENREKISVFLRTGSVSPEISGTRVLLPLTILRVAN